MILKCRELLENKDAYTSIMTLFEMPFEAAISKKQYNLYMFWLNQSRSEVGQPSPGNVKIRTVELQITGLYQLGYTDSDTDK